MPKMRKLVPSKAKAPSKLETSKAPASSGVPSKSRASEVGAVKTTIQDILGPAGAIARKLPGYEARPQQLAMAEAVAHAIKSQTHLLVEAGTGTGKSLAYLVPSILAAIASGKRVAVATNTLALQAQLLEKDLPLLKEVMPGRFTAVKVMGRSNYLSLRRLQNAVDDREILFGTGEDRDQLALIENLVDGLTEGAFSELGFEPKWFIRQEVESDRHDCMGKKCPNHSECFYYRAKARASGAEVVVVNHSLLVIDLMLRSKGAQGILPHYDVLIVDEAHTLEQVASGLLGITITSGQVDHLLNRISREPRGKDRPASGLLATEDIEGGIAAVGRARVISEAFFMDIASWRAKDLGGNGRVPAPLTKPGAFALAEALKKLASTLFAGVSHRGVKSLEADLDDGANEDDAGEDRVPESEMKFVAAARRCREIAKDLEGWLKQSLSDPSVYWVEVRKSVSLRAAPIAVGPTLKEELWSKVPTAILTSATLSVGSPPSFAYHQKQLALEGCRTLKLGSPFDYRSHVVVHIPRDLPDPAKDPKGFDHAVITRAIPHYVAKTRGRAFVLFTSNDLMRRASNTLRPWFDAMAIPLLVQGAEIHREKMIEEFKKLPGCVLFGVDSFWQGVDVQGEALASVIITKLPFRVPDTPIAEAREQVVKSRGGNAFLELSVPEACLKLRQGFGRLIRSASDRGIVVILDPRILSKPYGRTFLGSLPDCPRVFDVLPQEEIVPVGEAVP